MTELIAMSADQLAAALSSAGISVADDSALRRFLDSGTKRTGTPPPIAWPSNQSALAGLGAFAGTPIGHFQTYAADAVEDHYIMAEAEPDTCSLLSTINGQAVLAQNLSSTQLETIVVELLRPQDSGPASELFFDLSEIATFALFAVIDRLRLLTFASLIERVGLQSAALDLADLTAQFKAGAASPDNRWLGVLFGRLLDRAPAVTRRDLEAGCNELVKKGYLERIPAGKTALYSPDNIVLGCALDLLVPLPALLLEVSSPHYRAMVVSGKSLWLMRPHSEGYYFENVNAAGAVKLIRNVIGTTLDSGEAAAERPIKIGPVVRMGSSQGRDPVRAPVSEAPPPADAAKCARCGTALKSGQRFCTSCGAQTSL